jgi:hypothetical protein
MHAARRDRGQVLIITAFAMVVLIAIAAIVVDLGMSWMLHRKEQNAADPGSLAAAKWIRDTPATGTKQQAMEAEACFYAQQNGFFKSDANCLTALANGDLDVNSPPATTLAGQWQGTPGYVEVIIHDTHPSFFGQFFGNTVADVTTAAVAALTDGNANSSSLVALQDVCQGGAAANVNGGGTLYIHPADGVPDNAGGYIHVNSPCGNSTDDVCMSGVGEKAFSISGEVITPFAFVKGSCAIEGNSGIGITCEDPLTDPCLDEGATPLGDPLAGLPEPRLSSFPPGVCPDGTTETPTRNQPCQLGGNGSSGCAVTGTGPDRLWTCILTPGVYYAGWTVGSKTTLQLQPGMYIIAGGGITLQSSEGLEAVEGAGGAIEARITIFSTDGPGCPSLNKQCQGAINISAQSTFKASATNTASCQALLAAGWANTCPWRGILLWQDGTVANPGSSVSMGGGSSAVMAGTIYAPVSDVSIAGGNGTTGCSNDSTASCLSIQIISWTWTITGNSTVEMPYDPSELYILEQRGLVH